VRTAPALIAAAGLLLVSLTGCTAPGSASCDSAASAGSATKLISVSGDFGAKPSVEVPKPLYTKTTERDVVITGDGALVQADGTVGVNLMLLNGRTGEVLQQTDFNGPGASLIALAGNPTGFAKALACTTVGSRVVAAISSKDAFGPAGANEALGLKKDDTIILVADIHSAALPKADGAERPIPSGFPSVVTAPSGQPGITIPAASAPTETKQTLSRVGDGATVKAGDQVMVNYTGVLWDREGRVPDHPRRRTEGRLRRPGVRDHPRWRDARVRHRRVGDAAPDAVTAVHSPDGPSPARVAGGWRAVRR
jgi:hypothetical protein